MSVTIYACLRMGYLYRTRDYVWVCEDSRLRMSGCALFRNAGRVLWTFAELARLGATTLQDGIQPTLILVHSSSMRLVACSPGPRYRRLSPHDGVRISALPRRRGGVASIGPPSPEASPGVFGWECPLLCLPVHKSPRKIPANNLDCKHRITPLQQLHLPWHPNDV